MKDLKFIASDLFDKIKGRFNNLTIGDSEGNIVTEPEDARFFDFEYTINKENLGNVSIALSEDDGLTVIFSRDFVSEEPQEIQSDWYNFLKELRYFSKKRLLNFDVRDINKSILTKRDYKFLANRTGDDTMNESKMYGTNKTSYQKIGNARLAIKHTAPINLESSTGRTQKIGKIYIESPEGERFKYPFKHLSGARAMAIHVSEGGNAYDEFGKHIVGLSEELAKLRKFKTYMGRSAVMAESLSGYMDVVKERIATVKKTITSLQKPSAYKEAFESFNPPVLEDVPSDVAENWIDELTIKQFNEELQDIFPYIYNLVKEGTKAKELGPDDLVDEGERHGNSKIYDKCRDGWKKKPGATRGSKGSCIPEEEELEQGFEEMMGQFSENESDEDIEEGVGSMLKNIAGDIKNAFKPGTKITSRSVEKAELILQKVINKGFGSLSKDEKEFMNNFSQTTIQGLKAATEAKGKDLDKDGDIDSDDYMKAKDIAIKKAMGQDDEEDKDKAPLSEFILSYYDRETGEFPKGETAVLTMVEKDYGEEFIEPAKAFIEQVNILFDEYQMRNQPQQMEVDQEYDRIRELAGVRY